MNANQKRMHILELVSEDTHGSWEFWSTKDNKTEEEMEFILQMLFDLVKEKKIRVLGHKFQGHYNEVSLDIERLKKELEQSMLPYNVNPDNFY